MSLFTPTNVGQRVEGEQQPQFQPKWTEAQTRQYIKSLGQSSYHDENYKNIVRQHAAYYNIPFYEGEFDLLDALKHAGAGFFEGFTTFNIMEPADNEYEQIFRNLGHLAGFAPGLLAVPLTSLSKIGVKHRYIDELAGIAKKLNDKSIPMAGAKILTNKAKSVVKPILNKVPAAKAGAAGDAMQFLTGNMARHVMEGAFHLGSASAISSWQGGVDVMMESFLGGAVAGGVFRGIGNIPLKGTESENKVIRGIAGSLFMGLPSTMRGATTPEQIYEYVLGAYFGKGEKPWRDVKAEKFVLQKMPERAKTDENLRFGDPKLHPEFETLPPEVQTKVIDIAENGIPGSSFKGYGKPEENRLIHEYIVGKIDPDKLEEKPLELEGYEVARDKAGEVVYDAATGEPTYTPKRGFLSKFITRMTSGGAEGADRVFALEASEVGAPVINYTFKAHQPQALINKGRPRKLNKQELEEANQEVTASSISLDRPTANMSEYVLNLQRRNWHIVKHADAVYAVAPIIRKGDKAMQVVDGGTGWGVDMAIRNGKEVYVFDNSSKARHSGAISNQWHRFNPALGVFEPIEGLPPKPPKTWAGIGSREISKTGEQAIRELVQTYFKGKQLTPTKAELDELKKEKAKNRRLLKPVIDVLKEEISDIEVKIKEKEADLSKIDKGDTVSIEARNELDVLKGELQAKEQELELYLDPSKEFALDVESGTIKEVALVNPLPETLETNPGASVNPGQTPIQFVNKHLKRTLYGTNLDATTESSLLAQTIATKMRDYIPKKGEEIVNRSEEFASWIEALATKINNKTPVKLNLDARGTLRQWFAKTIFHKQVHYFGVEGDNVFDLNMGDPLDLNAAPPSTRAGIIRRNQEPIKLLAKMFEKSGGKLEDIPIGILDHITITEKDGSKSDYAFYRYKEKLIQDLRWEKDYTPEVAERLAEKEFRKIKANILRKLFKRGKSDYDGYYFYGGAGDKDRMHMVKFHPNTSLALNNKLLNQVLSIGKMSKEALLMQNELIREYDGLAGWKEPELKSLFSKSMMSNLLYDMQLNGFKVGNKAEILESAKKMFGGKGHWISDSKAFNKRSQIWFTNGIPGDVLYIKNFRDEKGKKIKLTEKDNFRYILVDDLPKEIKEQMEKDKLYSSDITRKSTELKENTDGSIIVEARSLKGIVGDSGQLEGNTPYDAQSKSFIISPSETNGALLAKYMMHSAGDKMSQFMRDKNINMIIHTSAAKQMGLRGTGDYYLSKDGMTIDAPIYEMSPSHIYHNYSVVSKRHMIDWQRSPKQLLSQLLDNAKNPFESKVIREILETIVGRRYYGEEVANKDYDRYIASDIEYQGNNINRLMRNIESISIDRIIDGIRRPGNDIFTQRLYEHMLDKNRELFTRDYDSGIMSDAEYKQAMAELSTEDSIYRRKLKAAKIWNQNNRDKVGKNAINGMMYDKDVRDYRLQVVKNFVVQEVSRPLVPNSAVGRLRPYDKGLRMDLDGLNPNLKELDKNDKIFFLDNGFKNMKIDIGDRTVTLEDLWNNRNSEMYRKGININDIFNALVLRVPMDSVSGAHVLKFKGFTGRNGYGTLIHGKAMKALGGADLDADEAHFFFGGKNGFRKSWKKGFLENKSEYYYNVDKNGRPVTKPVKGGRTIVGDNKSALLPEEIRKQMKLPIGSTYRDFLTENFAKTKKNLYLSRAAMYSLNERNRIMEAAVSGRAQMGATAVTPKQLMQQVHSMLGGGKDGTPKEDVLEFTKNWYNPDTGVVERQTYRMKIKPKTQDAWRAYARELGRAQVAFSSDPMDELGLKSTDFWFKSLWNAHFYIVNNRIDKVTKNKAGVITTEEAKNISFKDLTAWDLKSSGLYKLVNNLNKAYWGRNYRFDRKYTIDEIRELGKGIYTLGNDQRNNFLVNVAEKLQPLDWSDNLIGRLDRKLVLSMYNEINQLVKDKKWKPLKELMERSTFSVKESKELMQAIWKKSDLLTRWEKNEKGEWVEIKDTFNLWDAKQRKIIAERIDLFKEAIDYPTVNKKGKKGLIINPKKLDKALGKDKNVSRKELLRIREEILSDISHRAEDFLLNDLYTLASFRNLTNVFNKMKTLEYDKIPLMHEFSEKIKNESWLMAKLRRNITGFDWSGLTPEGYAETIKWMKDKKLSKWIPERVKVAKDRPSAALDQITIDKMIMKFRKDNKLTKNQSQFLDYLILGSYRRGNLSDIRELESNMESYDPVLKDLIHHLKMESAKTSQTRIGYLSKGLFSNMSVSNMVGEVSRSINDIRMQPTEEQIKSIQKTVEALPEKLKEEAKVDYLEQDALQPLTQGTGFEGLKKGVELSQVPERMRGPVSELVDYVKSENGKFQKNFNEVVRALLGKDINALNFQDVRILNNWFADVKRGTLMQRLFSAAGATELAKRHYWLFPRTVNRELMRDDIELMQEEGLYFTKSGEVKKGTLMRPTQNIEIVQKWIQRTMDSASEMSDSKVKWLKENLLFVNSIKDGEIIRQIAAREREKTFWDEKQNMTREDHLNAAEYLSRYNEIIKNHGDKLKKEYTVDIEGERKKLTGEQIKDLVNEKYTEFFKEMHEFITGEKGWMEKNKMYVGYWDKAKTIRKVDTNKFITYLLNSWRKGEGITDKIGIDNLRYVARSMMIDMSGYNKEFQSILKKNAPTPTKEYPFHTYFPHLHFNKKIAGKGIKELLKKIAETPLSEFSGETIEEQQASKNRMLESAAFKHHTLTGDWITRETEEWLNFEEVMEGIATKRRDLQDKISWFKQEPKAGNMYSRTLHIPGWSIDASVPEVYARKLIDTYHKQLAQIFSRSIVERMYDKMKPKWGHTQAVAWQKFMKLYVQDAIGNPSVIPDRYLNDPNMKLRGTPYAWWSDNNVAKKVNNIMESFGINQKDLPKELRGVDVQQLRHWSNLEAQYEMASLLAHPKSMVTNIFGGTMHTIESTGWKNWRNSRNISWLKQNINSKWNSMQDVMDFVVRSGVYPEYMIYEAGLNKEMKQARNKEFIEDVAKKMVRDPEMQETTLREIAKQYGVKDRIVQFAAKFMTVPEKMIRRDAFMSHYIQAWERYGGAIKDPEHPFLIEQAKKGVQATQFLYSAPFRPAFSRTALGKVMTRFQTWSWNSVRFRNDIRRQAKIYGIQPGSPEYERYARTMQIDLFVFALANMFAYSLFETALPAPWNWLQDTADWIFGDEKERDRAFFGQWPKQLAPLQMVTPPILRLLPSSARALIDDDWSKVGKYYVWTMFPFGRMGRDVFGEGNLVENPIRIFEKLSGFPLLQLQKEMTNTRKEMDEGRIIPTPNPGFY